MSLNPSFSLLEHDSIDSTNAEAKRLLSDSDFEGNALIIAAEQTQGKGRNNRDWVSERGNLFATILLQHQCKTSTIPQLTFVACNAIGEYLKSIVGGNAIISYKWPNDILLNDKKVAGLLFESELATEASGQHATIIGFGINVASCPDEVRFPATCLADEGVSGLDLQEIAIACCNQFNDLYNKWLDGGFDVLKDVWLNSASFLGKDIVCELANGQTLEGQFTGLGDDGSLILLSNGQEESVTAGEIVKQALAS